MLSVGTALRGLVHEVALFTAAGFVALLGGCGQESGTAASHELSEAGRGSGLDSAVKGSAVDALASGSDEEGGCPVRQDAAGNSSWARATQTQGNASISIVVRGACEDALVSGFTQAPTPWGTGTLPAGRFLSHPDAKGSEDWVRTWKDSNTGVQAMAGLPNGGFAAAGGLVVTMSHG